MLQAFLNGDREVGYVCYQTTAIALMIHIQGVSEKLSFTEFSICRFAMNIISISSQLPAGSPDAQFGKTQFFRHPVVGGEQNMNLQTPGEF